MSQPPPAFPVPPPPTLAGRLAATPLLVLLDVDGTLAPIAPTPADARVPERTRVVVQALARCDGVHVALVSGRAAGDAQQLVGVAGLWTIGNHGMESIEPAGARRTHPAIVPFQEDVVAAAREIDSAIADIPGALLEEKGPTASVHYRLVARERVREVQSIAGRAAAKHALRLTEGKEVLELRPPVDVNKGTAAVDLAGELGIDRAAGAVLYAGDDRTDEDAFRALRAAFPRAVTIRVGRDAAPDADETAAEYGVRDTEQLVEVLEWLTGQRRISASS